MDILTTSQNQLMVDSIWLFNYEKFVSQTQGERKILFGLVENQIAF